MELFWYLTVFHLVEGRVFRNKLKFLSEGRDGYTWFTEGNQ